ncbi:hypothetical protein M408DRAFT_332642 [Serendipita vermifera MAFF 305830]|uniref:Uncharacterized protein n=1 Tax=Serendipita vermifera MAFF 305830 TaxID=933852 RepID=A0A0C3AUM3_SERVB|nr:hypothetical protein M408DRAFT_332642 [Serendipita vermifera MAFF 305830]
MEGDRSVLLMFDPLASPPKLATTRETPRHRRELDPTSPVAAFFNTVDRSKNLLETVRKHKQTDLINLDQAQDTLHAIPEDDVEQATAGVMATPLPTFKLTVDPFSPATYATATPQLFSLARARDSGANNSLLTIDTPAKADLSMSTNFTPIPSGLPNLLNASFSSLRHSGTSSVTSSGRRRRSSVDLDKELHTSTSDSSFDILRGELEIGNSADASFITADESLRVVEAAESPWTIRTGITPTYKLGSSLLPVKELKESSLLAHEIPLPDSPPTSPESSEGHNEDATMNASKVFSHTRRFSMANLQFPTEGPSPPRSPGKLHQYRVNSTRKPTVHVRTTSMTSVSSAGSSRSGITIKGSSPSKQQRVTPTASPSRPRPGSATGVGGVVPAKRLPRPSIVGGKPPTVVAKPRMSVAPRASIAPTTGPVRKLAMGAPSLSRGVGPRASIASTAGSMAPPPVPVKRVPRASTASTASMQPPAKVGPRPSVARPSVGGAGVKQALRAPRASIVSTSSAAATAAAATKQVQAGQAGKVLAPSARANTTNAPGATRMARPSLIGGGVGAPGIAGGGVAAGAGGPGALRKVASAAGGFGVNKPIVGKSTVRVPTAVRDLPPVTVREVGPPTSSTQGLPRPRPRTSSAGAALISRPEYAAGRGDDYAERSARAARLVRPKSSLRV